MFGQFVEKSSRGVGKNSGTIPWRNLSPFMCTKRSRPPGREYGRLASWSPGPDARERALRLVVSSRAHSPRLITSKHQTRGRTCHGAADQSSSRVPRP